MRLSDWLNSIADAGSELLRREYTKRSTTPPVLIHELCAALRSVRGDAMGTALSREVVNAYAHLNEQQRQAFFRMLLSDYGPDPVQIQECATRYQTRQDTQSLRALTRAVEPPCQHLLRRINMAFGGTQTIVNMRRDLLQLIRQYPELKVVDDDFRHLLLSWFNPGFLTLQKIDWETRARVLEKLIIYEAVHPMAGWDDLRRRLEDDRRCFGFFHPSLPDEPLIFLQVALVSDMADAVQPILAPRNKQIDVDRLNTAVFYSISSTQEGLKGISFGNFLIKQVVMKLQKEMPQLKQFVTLSPIPGFMHWLTEHIASGSDALLSNTETERLNSLDMANWQAGAVDDSVKEPLMRLCAHYLYRVKNDGMPYDAVERFHLSNGATIERLNWGGDLSARRLQESAGILVNYNYDLATLEGNHESFFNEGKIATSKQFRRLLH